MRKILLRTFWAVLILCVLLFSTLLGLAYWYKPVALDAVEKALKQHCKGEVRYKWSSFGFFKKWGELTLSLYQISILPTPTKGKNDNATAHIAQVHFSFDWGAMWEQQYTLKRIYVEEIDAESSFLDVWQIPDSPASSLRLEEILIEKAQFDVPIVGKQDFLSFDVETASLQFVGKDLKQFVCKVKAEKCLYIHEKQTFWELKKMNLQSEITYTPKSKTLQFNETFLKIRDANFAIRGNCVFRENLPTALDFKFRSKEGDLQALLALLPPRYYDELGGYKAKGKLFFAGSVQGEAGKGKTPAVEASFGGEELEIISPHSLQQSITQCVLEGKIDAGVLRISAFEGKLGSQRFRSAFLLSNWSKPHLVATIEAGFDLSALHEFYPLARWETLNGLGGLKLHLDTDLAEIYKTTTEAKKILATGEFELINVSAKPQEGNKAHQKVNAKIVFQNDGAEVRNLQTQWGNNDLTLKGKVQNWLAYLFIAEQPLHFRGELASKFVQLADFINPTLALPATLQGQIRLSIDSLAYQKLHAKKVKADLTMKDKILKSGNLTLQIAEGSMSFLGILNAQKENFITLDGRIILKNTQASQIWYAFGNFGQKIIQDSQITGKLDADIRSGLVFDKNLVLKLNHAVCDAELTFTKGELKEVQVLNDLAQKVQLPEIRTLPYNEMHALLQLRNQTLFVPEWEVVGNYNLGVVGRATTEKGLDFRVRLQPKRNLVYHINWTGNTSSFQLAYPPDTEQPHLETNWKREKEAYLKIFKSNTSHESVKIDTMKIGD